MIIFYGKSDSQKNKARVIGEGQWMIQDHYLVMKRWTPRFNSCEESFG